MARTVTSPRTLAVPSEWRFRAPLRPALRRGLLTAIPVGAGLLLDLEIDSPGAGAISTAAMLAGFVAFDAAPRTRLVWQLLTAPAIGAAAALGALTGEPPALAVVTMTLFASLAGLSVAVSPRLSVAGLICVLALLLAQGLSLDAHSAPAALLLGAGGATLQALFLFAVGFRPGRHDRIGLASGIRGAVRDVRSAVHTGSTTVHHAIRWGGALGLATALYHLLDLGSHGYWIPLTVLFVLKPAPDETVERVWMRAAGTLAGLAVATPLALLIDQHAVLDAIALAITAALAFALLAIEYALFTMAITAFVVLLAHALGQSAVQAADERGIATLLGIGIAVAAMLVWRAPARTDDLPQV